MALFNETIKGLQDFNDNIKQFIGKEIITNKRDLIAINIANIYSEGKGSEGQKLERNDKSYSIYSPGYTKFKKKLGLYQGHVDFHLTGGLLESIDVVLEDNTVVFTAQKINGSWDIISLYTEKYGDFLGLTDDEWKDVTETILVPAINNYYLKIWQ